MPILSEEGAKVKEVNSKEYNDNNNKSGNQESATINGQKKKRSRQRLRIRNKNYHLLVGNSTPLLNGNSDRNPQRQSAFQSKEIRLNDGNCVVIKKSGKNIINSTVNSIESLKKIDYTNTRKDMKSNVLTNTTQNVSSNCVTATTTKTREQIMAEREAKKLAKQAKKVKSNVPTVDNTANAIKLVTTSATTTAPTTMAATITATTLSKEIVHNLIQKSKQTKPPATNPTNTPCVAQEKTGTEEKTREQIKAEREAKKQAKQLLKIAKTTGGSSAITVEALTKKISALNICETVPQSSSPTAISVGTVEQKKPALTKVERRAIQERQRAAKAEALAQSQKTTVAVKTKASLTSSVKKSSSEKVPASRSSPSKNSTSPSKSVKWSDCCVLFKHLENPYRDVSLFLNNPNIHPSVARLGVQYAKRTIVGSNARCIAFLNALKMVIQDFETPPKKEFGRSLENYITNSVEHLQKCRPLAVSVSNAFKHIKHVLTQLPTEKPEIELKENVCHFIDTYIENQIGKAAQAISSSVQEKITNGDVILTFGCSSLIDYICEEAQRRKVNFRVIVIDSRPFCEGQELLRRLTAKGIPCTYVLINAVGFVMPEATKVLLGAHALLSNGYVMARTGTAQVALVAHSFNVPVLVCCETHKFSERYQTDAIVYNELGNPDDLIRDEKCCLSNWQAKCKITPLNLMYDITPPELVTAVVTEVSILPCTSVPVILRIKPTEIGYYS